MADESREIAATFKLRVDKSGFDQAEASIDGLKRKLGPTAAGKSSGDSVSAILDGLEKKFAFTGKTAAKTDEYGKAFDQLKKRYAGLSEIGKDLAKANRKPDDSILDSIIPGLNPKKTAAAGVALDGLKGHHSGLMKEFEELFKEGVGGFGEMGEKVGGLVEKLGSSGLAGALGAVAAGAGVAIAATAGLIELAKASAEVADQADKMAQKTGITTEEWQRLAYAGKMAGTDAGELKSALQQVADTYEDARKGGAEQVKTLRALGLTWRDLKGQSPAQMLETISDRLVKLPSTERIAVAKKIGKSWSDLLPLLTAGHKGLKELGDEAEKFNVVMGEEQIKTSIEFNDNWFRTTKILEGFRNVLAKELLPIMEHAVKGMVDWYRANKEFVDRDVTTVVKGIAGAFKLWGASLQPVIAALDYLVVKPMQTLLDLTEDIQVWAAGGESLLGDMFTFLCEKLKEWAYDVEQYMKGIIPVDKWLKAIDEFIAKASEKLGFVMGGIALGATRTGASPTRSAIGGVAGQSSGILDSVKNLNFGAFRLPAVLEKMGGGPGPEPIGMGINGEPIYASAAPSIPTPSIPAGGLASYPPGEVNVSGINNTFTINGATDERKVASMIQSALDEQWREVEASVP